MYYTFCSKLTWMWKKKMGENSENKVADKLILDGK